MALAHNGNLTNALELRDKLELSGAIFHTTSYTETIAYVITRERLMTPSIEEAVSTTMNLLEGAYSLVLMSSAKMIAARDPYGFRPLCYGRRPCLLYTSDAADDGESVDLGGRRIIKKNFFKQKTAYEIMPSLVGSEMCIRDRPRWPPY